MSASKTSSVAQVIQALNERAPLGTAEAWDNVGLLIGDSKARTSGAIVSIDLTTEAIDLALENKYSLIVTHHPCIFPAGKGLTRLTAGSPVYRAVENRIAVAAYHTNFDQCSLEVVHAVADGLGIKPKGRLIEKSLHSLLKLATFVPVDHLEKVRRALCEAGAGHIGNYDSCTFQVEGESTFRGGKETHPFHGRPEEFEKVKEIRLETVFPKGMRGPILDALFKSHPYEEVAYDLYPLEQFPTAGGLVRGFGYGFWGEFPSPKAFSDLCKDVKNLFNIHGFWITNPPPSQVTRVGFVAGKGTSFVEAAASLNCDLLITGEVGYHKALGGATQGLAVMELGHRESERFFMETMKNWFSALDLECIEARSPTQQIWLGGTK